MTDSSYASSPEMPHRIHPPYQSKYGPKAITGVAGAGFRLSLALNAVGTESALRHEMASADIEIQVIAKKISDFSLMLKQAGKIVEENRTIASPTAIDTVAEIKDQGEKDFDEIKSMTEMVQKRDEQGHFKGIEVAQRVTWAFKKRKMQYLLGQLEYLKDSLAIMLQTLQLGKEIASAYEGKTRPPSQYEIAQERAEIQNMIIVQHWSMLELQKLYGLAEQESMLDIESPASGSPPPSYDAAPPGNHLTLTIENTKHSPQEEDDTNSKALVKYQERPLNVMKESCERVREREERALGAPVNDIVDHLLDTWTQVGVRDYYNRRHISAHPHPKSKPPNKKHQSRVESDESDTSEHDSDFERSQNIGGYYIEGPRGATKKNVRFRVVVEDEEDEEYARPRQTTKKHQLGTVDEFTSSESDSSLSPSPPSQARRTSTSSNGSHAASMAGSERQRRPYRQNSYDRRNSHELPTSRPGSRGMPQPPPMTGAIPAPLGPQPIQGRPVPVPMPMSAPNVHWHGQGQGQSQGHHPPTPGLRPPNQSGAPIPRAPSNGSPFLGYAGPSPGASPVTPHGSYFPPMISARGGPPPLSMNVPSYPPARLQRPPRQTPSRSEHNGHGHGHSHKHRNGSGRSDRPRKEEQSASRNVKKGILGGTAIAGMMEILQGLDGL